MSNYVEVPFVDLIKQGGIIVASSAIVFTICNGPLFERAEVKDEEGKVQSVAKFDGKKSKGLRRKCLYMGRILLGVTCLLAVLACLPSELLQQWDASTWWGPFCFNRVVFILEALYSWFLGLLVFELGCWRNATLLKGHDV
jgi:hypothetical protein